MAWVLAVGSLRKLPIHREPLKAPRWIGSFYKLPVTSTLRNSYRELPFTFCEVPEKLPSTRWSTRLFWSVSYQLQSSQVRGNAGYAISKGRERYPCNVVFYLWDYFFGRCRRLMCFNNLCIILYYTWNYNVSVEFAPLSSHLYTESIKWMLSLYDVAGY